MSSLEGLALPMEPIATMPCDITGQCLVYGRVWAMVDDAGKEDIELWERPQFYITESVREGVIMVNPGFVTAELAECNATFWCRLTAPK